MSETVDCTNCNTTFEIGNPTLGSDVECPICFTRYMVNAVSPINLAFIGDDFGNPSVSPDQAEPASNIAVVHEHPSSAHIDTHAQNYLCVPFNAMTRSNDSSPAITLSSQLQSMINQYYIQGWIFKRIDTLRINVQPACIAGLLGASIHQVEYDVIVFSREDSVTK